MEEVIGKQVKTLLDTLVNGILKLENKASQKDENIMLMAYCGSLYRTLAEHNLIDGEKIGKVVLELLERIRNNKRLQGELQKILEGKEER